MDVNQVAIPQNDAYLDRLTAIRKVAEDLQMTLQSLLTNDKTRLLFSQDSSREAMLDRCKEYFHSANVTLPQVDSDVGMIQLINNIRAFQAEKDLINFFMEYREEVGVFTAKLADIYESFIRTIYPKQDALFQLSTHLLGTFGMLVLVERYVKRMVSLKQRTEIILNKLDFLQTTNSGDQARHRHGNYLESNFSTDHMANLNKLLDSAVETFRLEEIFITSVTREISEKQQRRQEIAGELHAMKTSVGKKNRALRLAHTAGNMFRTDLKECQIQRKALELEMASCRSKLLTLNKQKQMRKNILEFLNIGMPKTATGYRLNRKKSEITRQLRYEQMTKLRTEQSMQKLSVLLEESMKRSRKLELRIANFSVLKQSLNVVIQDTKVEQRALKEEKRKTKLESDQLQLLQSVKMCEETRESLEDRPLSMKISNSLRQKVMNVNKNKKPADHTPAKKKVPVKRKSKKRTKFKHQ